MNAEPTNTAAFDTLLDELKCPVCKELLNEPFVTACGHTFCHTCIMQTTSQRCPCCGKYMIIDQVKPVFVLDKILMAAHRMAEARSSSGAQLASFLWDTPVIQTCQEVDGLIDVLNQRRSSLEREQVTAQLHLLYLFLDHVKQSTEAELAEGSRRLCLVEKDLHTEDELGNSGHAPASPSIVTNTQWPANGAQADENNPADHKWHQKIGEHFGEMQESYLRMCGSQSRFSNTVGAVSGGSEQAAGVRPQAPHNKGTSAALPHDFMKPHMNSAAQRRETNSPGQGAPERGGHAGCSAAAEQPQSSLPMADAPTQSRERLDELDCTLRTVTQYSELRSVLEMLPARPGKRAVVTGLDFNATAELIAAGGAGAHIQLHHYSSVLAAGTRVHAPVAELPVSMRIASLAFSPVNASQLLSCGDASGTIHLWDVTANSITPSSTPGAAAPVPTPRAFSGHTGRVRSVSYRAQQPHMFASGSDDGSMRVWDIRSPSGAACSAELGSNVCGIAFNPWDENILACGTAAHSVSVFDIRNCKAPVSQVQGLEKTVAYVRFLSASELAAASVNSTITLWRWENMVRLQAFSGHVNVSNFAGMATCGDYIACGSETSQVHVYCKQLSRPIMSHTLAPAQMPASSSYFTLATVWKPHSATLVVSLSTGSCHILEMDQGRSRDQ